jgi:P27 family predicted phage terminase small subunit
LSTNEPDPEPAIPPCPSHLDKVAKKEWRRVSNELLALGIISRLDRAALGGYCDAYGRWAEAARQIQKYGLIFKSPSGYPMPSPYLAILHTALDQMRAFLTEFGLSPASRSRVRGANPKQRDLFDAFLDGDDEEAVRESSGGE